MTKKAAIYIRVSTDGQTTDNQRSALEEVAEAHSDTFMVLDEMARLSDSTAGTVKESGNAGFVLASGQGKRRSVRYGIKGVGHAEWRVHFISTGEKGLANAAKSAGLKRLEGEQVRFIDIPAEANPEHGIFDE